MSDKSSIEWTDATWNPVTGCNKVSPGCNNCYAEPMALRLQKMGAERYRNGFELTVHESVICQPLKWKDPKRIFVNSMSDLFHADVPNEFVDKVFAAMALCPQHTFQVLTKRADRMMDYMKHRSRGCGEHFYSINEYARELSGNDGLAVLPTQAHGMVPNNWPLPHVWLGVSVENQPAADERIPDLIQTPAAVRFVSVEPMLGKIDIGPYLPGCQECEMTCGWRAAALDYPPEEQCDYCGERYKTNGPEEFCTECDRQEFSFVCPDCGNGVVSSHPDTVCLDWVICGGESGPKARPMQPEWAMDLRDQCVAADVPFMFKQWGGVNKKAAGRLLEGRIWNEFPRKAA